MKLRFHVHCPYYVTIPIPDLNWTRTLHGNFKELVPIDALPPLGEDFILTSYVDANLCHDCTTGNSVTRISHLINQTVIYFFSKKQPSSRLPLTFRVYGS